MSGRHSILAVVAALVLVMLGAAYVEFAHDPHIAQGQQVAPFTQTAPSAPDERILQQPSPNGWTAVPIVDGQGHASVFYYFDPEVGVRCYRDSSQPIGCVRIGAEP